MKELIRTMVWFMVLNFIVANNIFIAPVWYWWIIEIVILIISIIMVDKK